MMRFAAWIQLVLGSGVACARYAHGTTCPPEPKFELSASVVSESGAVSLAGKPEELVLAVVLRNMGDDSLVLTIAGCGLPCGMKVTLYTQDGGEVLYGWVTVDMIIPLGEVTLDPGQSKRFELKMADFHVELPKVVIVEARWSHPSGLGTFWAKPIRVSLLGPGGEEPRLTPQEKRRLEVEEQQIRDHAGELRMIAKNWARVTSESVEGQLAQSSAGDAEPCVIVNVIAGAGGAVVGGGIVWLLTRRRRRTS